MSALSEDVYSQNFDSLAASTSTSGSKDWLNGITLPHWQAWKGGDDVKSLAGKPIALHFEMKDADIYAYRFGE